MVEPFTSIVHVVPSRLLSVKLFPLTALTVPATRGRTTSIDSTVKLPSLWRVCWNRTVSPTLRSVRAIFWPALVIVVLSGIVMVRVQPSTVFREIFDPSIEVMVIGPKANPPKPRSPRKPGQPRIPGPAKKPGLRLPTPGAPPLRLFGLGCALADGLAAGAGDAARVSAALTSRIPKAPRTTPMRRRSGPRSLAEKCAPSGGFGSVAMGDGTRWSMSFSSRLPVVGSVGSVIPVSQSDRCAGTRLTAGQGSLHRIPESVLRKASSSG